MHSARAHTVPASAATAVPHPMVVMKLEVKESSEKRRSRQLFPTPACPSVYLRVYAGVP